MFGFGVPYLVVQDMVVLFLRNVHHVLDDDFGVILYVRLSEVTPIVHYKGVVDVHFGVRLTFQQRRTPSRRLFVGKEVEVYAVVGVTLCFNFQQPQRVVR